MNGTPTPLAPQAPAEPQPTLGRIVIYSRPVPWPHLGQREPLDCAAVITGALPAGCAALLVMPPGEDPIPLPAVSRGDTPGTWRWPART